MLIIRASSIVVQIDEYSVANSRHAPTYFLFFRAAGPIGRRNPERVPGDSPDAVRAGLALVQTLSPGHSLPVMAQWRLAAAWLPWMPRRWVSATDGMARGHPNAWSFFLASSSVAMLESGQYTPSRPSQKKGKEHGRLQAEGWELESQDP